MGSQEARLARAAAALAEAEGVAGVGPSQGGPTPDARGSDTPRGRAATPPPDDPRSKGAEADPFAVARAIVLRQLALAPRSRAQLEKKLRERGCPDEVAEQVLDRMTDVGLVDDEAYAEMLVRSKQSTRGLARRALAHELRKQGIDGEVADEALSQVGHEDERDKAEQLVAKKLRSMHGLDADTQARRLAGMLARKGYSGEVAWPVIRDAISRAAEHQRD
ncbi:MAG TPA: regulatory protein RecX [Dermatophilaceae bacterium]|nr:regulatory protein RecX [Dermatophilaceae bacterium]